MRIGLEVSTLISGRSGLGVYAELLLDGLRNVSGVEVIPLSPFLSEDKHGSCDLSSKQRLGHVAKWLFTELPGQAKRADVDLVHFTNPVVPPYFPAPFVITLHDVCMFSHPHFFPTHKRYLTRALTYPTVLRARRILTVSHTSKREIVKWLPVRPGKIDVVPTAPNPVFHDIPDETAIQNLRKKYDLPETFVLFIGAIDVRKNLLRLARASQLWRREKELKDVPLIAVGPYFFHPRGKEYVLGRLERMNVRHVGFFPQEELPLLLHAASVLAYPSLCEGYGVPVAEAMAAGTPVVTSKGIATEEVARDAALLVDPRSVQQIADAVTRILTNPNLVDSLRTKGRQRVKVFSWKRVVEETVEFYRRALA